MNYNILKDQIKDKAIEFGFLEAKISSIIIDQQAQSKFAEFLNNGYAGEMTYLKNNQNLRYHPAELHPTTLAIISVKMPYLSENINCHQQRLKDSNHAYVSSYALGRDYHKVVKQQLQKYAQWINQLLTIHQLEQNYRVFTDSAPIMEVQLATQAGNGWRGKNTLLINKNHGSMFFLGELFTSLPLPPDEATTQHCGSCQKCLEICPTQAFVTPYVLDARKCIAYLTIENPGAIPVELRSKIGNRIYGCDDCQLFCPWNKFSQLSSLNDFTPRNQLDSSSLLELFAWSEIEFKQRLQGSPILRIGYQAWQRNIAVGLGNAAPSNAIRQALELALPNSSPLVTEHILWALEQQQRQLITNIKQP